MADFDVEVSLRDMFAAGAMEGMCSGSMPPNINEIGRFAYRIADAMLAARAKPAPADPRDALIAELVEALQTADGCFEAACAEGWNEAVAAGEADRIRDLWARRIAFARDAITAAIAFAKAKSESENAE